MLFNRLYETITVSLKVCTTWSARQNVIRLIPQSAPCCLNIFFNVGRLITKQTITLFDLQFYSAEFNIIISFAITQCQSAFYFLGHNTVFMVRDTAVVVVVC